MSESRLETEEEMRNALVARYGKVPEGNIEAYSWLRMQTGIDEGKLDYDRRSEKYKIVCRILGFSAEGGLAGRDINEF